MSRSLISTATAICMGSLLLLGCQPTGSGSSGTTAPPTTVHAHGEGDNNEGDNNDGNNGHGGDNNDAPAPAVDMSCPALRSAVERLTDLSQLLGNLTQPVLDQARAGDAGGLDPRTLGKTLGVITPLGNASSDMAASLAALQPIFTLLQTALQPDVALDPTALDQLRAGGGVVAAAADKLLDRVTGNCPTDTATTTPADTTTTTPADTTTTTPADTTTTTPADTTTTTPPADTTTTTP